MEKLIEEIRKEHCKTCLFLRSLAEDKCGASIERCKKGINRDVTLVLSAVRDGRLDEELGVVGRTPYRARVIWDEWVIKVLRDGATEFIALSGRGQRGGGMKRLRHFLWRICGIKSQQPTVFEEILDWMDAICSYKVGTGKEEEA